TPRIGTSGKPGRPRLGFGLAGGSGETPRRTRSASSPLAAVPTSRTSGWAASNLPSARSVGTLSSTAKTGMGSPRSIDFSLLSAAGSGMIDRPTMALPKTAAEAEDILRDPDVARLLASPEHQGLELQLRRQIYTNRNLRMDAISMVGFDMDYTLAVYSMRNIEELAFQLTLQRMVEKKGYPRHIEALKYDHEFVIRGLVVDKDHGNIFKMDRHNHVGRCYHGRQPLGSDQRKLLYQNEKI